ncbi:MAG: hypothetical protein RLO51_23810 [Thalassobaculum sp.]|uniref:hypothetical protein n=1 Tax=Thalassobaculum sp. TaxID=2022740 RepID=UPI0032F06863
MIRISRLVACGLVAVGVVLGPLAASAQTANAPAANAPTADAPTAASPASGFDGYRVLAVTAGVIGGAAVAVIVTDGLILPVYALATGAEAVGPGLIAGMAGGAGAGAGEVAVANGLAEPIGRYGYHAFRGAAALLGALGGGFFVDSWYTGS